MDYTDDNRRAAKKRAKVGDDGLTKHQRYYRRNAVRLKKESAERQRSKRQHSTTSRHPNSSAGSSNDECSRILSSRQSDCAVQTDVLDTSPSHPARVNLSDVQNHLNSLTSSYTKTSLRHLYKDLGKLEEKTQRRLLELRQSVSSWSSASGGYLMWNETLQLQVHAMGRHDRDAVENLLGVLLMRKVAGQELLCRLYDMEEDDMPCNAYEWLVKSRSRLHLISVVSLGLGITDVWMLILNRKLQQLNGVREDEALVIDQLLASDEEDW